MAAVWTCSQVVALSPNAAAMNRGRALADVAQWPVLGSCDQAIWGECTGSGKKPCQTIIDLSEPAFRCSCPSRQFPCKHALGLFLLYVQQTNCSSDFSTHTLPDWGAQWLAKQMDSKKKAADKSKQTQDRKNIEQDIEQSTEQDIEQSTEQDIEHKLAKATNSHQTTVTTATLASPRQAKRTAKVAAGLVDLDQWLQDIIRQGLAELPSQSYSVWDQVAARLVDAQAPGLAKRVQALAGILHSGEAWPERLLKALGELSVLSQSFQNRESLSDAMQAEVRSQIGFTQTKDDLLARSRQNDPLVRSHRDTWHVLGKRILKEDALKMQRVWLWGAQCKKAALVLSFAYGRRQKLDASLVPGSCFEGELVFYPGTGVQRAIVASRQGAVNDKADTINRDGIGFAQVEAAIAHYAQSLTENPWQSPFPLTLAQVTLHYRPAHNKENTWWLQDSQGKALALYPSFEQGWELLAMSGGRPLTVFGEWERDSLMPLSIWSTKKFLPLEHPTLQTTLPYRLPYQPSNPIADWQKFVSAALIGTDRQRPTLPAADSKLTQLLHQLDWTQPESALLQSAGIVAMYERVGRRSIVSFTQVKPIESDRVTHTKLGNVEHPQSSPLAKPDALPCCSNRTARQLQQGLARYPQALSELLSLLATAGQRAPAKHLPDLLRLGQKQTDLQSLIMAVMDNRGRWLAEQNPDWHYATVPVEEISADVLDNKKSEWGNQWQIGNRQQRLAAIRSWRRVDPAGAREAIAGTWKGESWRERESAIALFKIGLSMEDEPFLEAALCDRAKAVRQQAAEHLSKLSDSRWCQRMANRAQGFVHLTTNKLTTNKLTTNKLATNKLTITLTLPKDFDPSWEKDALSKKTIDGLGEQASWLQQLIANTPLATWNVDATALTTTFATTLTTHPDRELLIHSWAQAICNQQHEDIARLWAPALLNQFSAYAWDLNKLTVLVSLLPTQQKEQYLRSQVPPHTNDQNSAHWLKLIAQCQASWDYSFSQLILKQLAQVMKRKHKYGTVFSPSTSLALTLHPGLAPEAAKTIGEIMVDRRVMRSWQRFADEFVGLLEYRWAMYQAFAGSR